MIKQNLPLPSSIIQIGNGLPRSFLKLLDLMMMARFVSMPEFPIDGRRRGVCIYLWTMKFIIFYNLFQSRPAKKKKRKHSYFTVGNKNTNKVNVVDVIGWKLLFDTYSGV